MRSLNSIKNTIVSVIMSVVSVLITLIAQKIFLGTLGEEYLGLNGLFGDILSVLAIAELGFGSAIIYSMYAPLKNNDTEELKSLMKFYKNVYRIIALIVTVLGIALIPFLNILVSETSIDVNLTFLYFLFLFDVIASYLLSYKRSILYANQQTYIINLVHIAYLVLMNVTQISILLLTKNYIFYLVSKIGFRILENVVITIIANKKYPYITEKNVKPLSISTKNEIKQKIHGLIFHKIGATGINSTDNMIISYFLGVAKVGLLTNYTTLTNGLNILITQIFSALTASVGNLLLENDKEKSYSIYKSILLLNFWIYSFAAIGLVCLFKPVIIVWIGEKYLLSFSLLLALCINFYFSGMKKTFILFKDAAGIFYEDRYVPILEIIVNIVSSIILIHYFELTGVIIGTILSSLVVFLYSYPKFIYKPLFNGKYSTYLKEQGKYLLLFILTFILCISIMQIIPFTNIWSEVLVGFAVAIIIPNSVYLLLFYKTDEFKYYISLLNVLKEAVMKKKEEEM